MSRKYKFPLLMHKPFHIPSSVIDGYAYTQPYAPRVITQYPVDNPNDPRDPRVEKQLLDYDANGNLTHIEREINNPDMPMDTARESVQKLVWDEEDRLLGVDLRPESDREQPHIAAYTYDAGGERGIRYVPRQQEGVSSGATSGYAQDMDIMLYPNALITVRPQELPEDFDPMRIHPEHTFTTYTKHYYIGSERINSKLGTVNNLGLLCEEMGPSTDLINEMNDRANGANKWLEKLYHYLDKELEIDSPYLYNTSHSLVCGFKSHNPKLYDAYWYHPDHLGSSSFITNTTGEISQHMEYLPFGETLVEEHLNSYNSPFKFNAKEFDAETGNYYYGARYMNPKWSMWLGVDPLAEQAPGWTPYRYGFNNPLRYTDPDGRWEWDATGNLVAQKGDNSYSMAKFLGTSQKNAMTILNRGGVTTNDKGVLNLKEGQSFAKSSLWVGTKSGSGAVVNNTKEATSHYFNGKGASADVGDQSTRELLSSSKFQEKHTKITSTVVDPEGYFSVDLTKSTFHIGRTNVDYSVGGNETSSSVNYTLFSRDGFWDPDFIDEKVLGGWLNIDKFKPDGKGPNLERLGGTPYDYKTRERTYFFKPVKDNK